VIVHDVKYDASGRLLRLSANAEVESARVGLQPWFDFSHEVGPVECTGDVFAAGLLTPCMLQGEDLHIEAPVSARLMAGIEEIQAILCAWYPQLRRITISAARIQNDHPSSKNSVGCFFSAGVDAWYSLCKHQDEVADLVVVRGFDIPIDGKHEIWDQTLAHVQGIGRALGKRVIEVQTNIRAIADMGRSRAGWGKPWDGDFWGECMHGSALAGVALAMQGILKRIYIGATYSYDYMAAWGSHPLLDHHWSTGTLEVVHDGAEADRMQKIRRIAELPLALSTLRVCYENLDRRYNCCTCEKCCRTMMALRACGKLKAASAFPHPLDLKKVRRRLYDGHELPWYRAILPDARAAGDTELVDALQVMLGERFSMDQLAAKWKHRLRSAVPALQPALNLISRDRRKNKATNHVVMTEHPGTA
jgi:hypothetical protein